MATTHPVPDTKRTHRHLLRTDRRNAARPRFSPNLGARGAKNKNDRVPRAATSRIVTKAAQIARKSAESGYSSMRSGGGARPRSRSPGSSGSSSSRSAGSSDGIGTAKPGGRRPSSRPEPFSSSRPGRSPSCLEPEMRQEVLGGAVGDRAARHLAAAARPDPAGLQQHVERALRHRRRRGFPRSRRASPAGDRR